MLEVICGPMFSGKTAKLLRRVSEAEAAGERVAVVRPSVDTRHAGRVVSHDGASHLALDVAGAEELRRAVGDATVVAADEAQMFGEEAATVLLELAARSVRVLVAGLDLDFRGRPFGPMPLLLAAADRVDELRTTCARCGAEATMTQRLRDGRPAPLDDETVVIGGADLYEPRCARCYAEERAGSVRPPA
ncbi:MAG TPA: thymidine kinase [Gaiellaceae bacterium]